LRPDSITAVTHSLDELVRLWERNLETKKEGESMRRKLVLWSVLLIAGFLAGFILQYARLQRVQQELSASTKQLGSCQSNEQLSRLRDTATMMYLEVVQKNYGKAGEHAKEFFDQAQRIGSNTEDPALQNLLRDILASRDQITGDLAKGDAVALSEIQPVLFKLERTAKHWPLGVCNFAKLSETRRPEPARRWIAFSSRNSTFGRFGSWLWVSHSDSSSALAPHFPLNAAALIFKTINSDQLYETRSLILEIHKVPTVEAPLVNKSGLVRIWYKGRFPWI
jgi:hypothetical protein